MKNILKIMLMMITIFTIAGSAVYAAEIPVSDQDQLITSRDWTEISNLNTFCCEPSVADCHRT